MLACPRCGGRPPLCDACVAQDLEQLGGTARARGWAWAGRVIAQVGTSKPWPAFAGRCAELARGKVTDLSRDPRVLEELARACWDEARKRYFHEQR
jgi:hypothetical protein